jgi:hypothetical protein
VHAKAATSVARPRPGRLERSTCTPRIAAQIVNDVAATKQPVTIDGNARPRNTAKRFAGEASRAASVCERRSPAVAWPIPNMPVTAIARNAFPIRKNRSFCTPAKRPR